MKSTKILQSATFLLLVAGVPGCQSTPSQSKTRPADTPVPEATAPKPAEAEPLQMEQLQVVQQVVVTRPDQLPARTYEIRGNATELMASSEVFDAMAGPLERDIRLDLATYDIRDVQLLKQLYGVLMNVAIMQGRYGEARIMIEKIRDLETKEATILTTGLVMQALVDAWEDGGPSNPASMELFERYLQTRLQALPWEVVEQEIRTRRRNAEVMNEAVFRGIITTGLDPMLEQEGSVDYNVARQLVTLKAILSLQMPLMPRVISVYQGAIDRHDAEGG